MEGKLETNILIIKVMMAMTMVMVDDHFDGNDDGDGDGANDPGVFFPLHCSTTG